MPLQPIMGQIMPFAGSTVPKGWALCNGALLAIQTNQALFSLLRTDYGGDGVTNFALPDLRGRVILGSSGDTGPYPAGTKGGSVSVTLSAAQLPAHSHGVQATTTQGTGRGASPGNNIFAANILPADDPKKIFVAAGQGEVQLSVGTNIGNEGRNQPHNNMQPYLAINYLIALQGIFPSRN